MRAEDIFKIHYFFLIYSDTFLIYVPKCPEYNYFFRNTSHRTQHWPRDTSGSRYYYATVRIIILSPSVVITRYQTYGETFLRRSRLELFYGFIISEQMPRKDVKATISKDNTTLPTFIARSANDR